jgi:hypothetical protein
MSWQVFCASRVQYRSPLQFGRPQRQKTEEIFTPYAPAERTNRVVGDAFHSAQKEFRINCRVHCASRATTTLPRRRPKMHGVKDLCCPLRWTVKVHQRRAAVSLFKAALAASEFQRFQRGHLGI